MRNVHQMQRSTGSQGWVWVQMKNTIALQQLHPWHLFWCVLTVVDPVRRPTNQPSEVVSREKQPRDMRHHSTEHPNLYDTTVGKSRHPKRQLHQHELIPARTYELFPPHMYQSMWLSIQCQTEQGLLSSIELDWRVLPEVAVIAVLFETCTEPMIPWWKVVPKQQFHAQKLWNAQFGEPEHLAIMHHVDPVREIKCPQNAIENVQTSSN